MVTLYFELFTSVFAMCIRAPQAKNFGVNSHSNTGEQCFSLEFLLFHAIERP